MRRRLGYRRRMPARFAMNLARFAPLTIALAVVPACNQSSGTTAPGLVEGVGNDIGNEVDGAGNTASGVGDDVSGGANDVVDGVSGSPDAPPAESADDDAAPATDEAAPS